VSRRISLWCAGKELTYHDTRGLWLNSAQ